MITEIAKTFHEKDEAKRAELEKKLTEEVWPKNLAIFESFIAKNNGWLVGNDRTWADMYFTTVISWMGDKKDAALAKFPLCKALADKVNGNPKIAEWIKIRPVTVM